MTDPHAIKEEEHQGLLEQLKNVLQAVKQDLAFYTFFLLNIYDQVFAAFYARVILNPIYGTLALCSSNYMEDSVLKTNIYVRQKVTKGQREAQHSLLKCQLVPNRLFQMQRSIILQNCQLSPAFVQDIQWQWVEAKAEEQQLMY